MDFTKEQLMGFYRRMLRIRLCEEAFVAPILSGEVRCPCHLYSGEEAIAVGVCAALTKRDYVFGNHRSHGHYLAKGGSMAEMAAEEGRPCVMLGPIIPPSVMFVVYSVLAQVAVSDMLIAGIIPGILLTLLFFVVIACMGFFY